jgi:hypothetical protein
MSSCLDFRIYYFSEPLASASGHRSLTHFSRRASRQALHRSPRRHSWDSTICLYPPAAQWAACSPLLTCPRTQKLTKALRIRRQFNHTLPGSRAWNGNDTTGRHHSANKDKKWSTSPVLHGTTAEGMCLTSYIGTGGG